SRPRQMKIDETVQTFLVSYFFNVTITDSESESFKDFRETEIPQPLPIASSPVPSLDDPYLIVRQAHIPAAIDTESEPEEAPSETEELQPLAARTTPPSSDHTPTSPDPTLVSPLTDEDFEASEPSDTRITSSHSTAPSDFTTPLSPDYLLTQTAPTPMLSQSLYYCRTAHMVVRTQPAMSPGLSARVTEAMALSPSLFRKRHIPSYETPSSSSLALSQTLLVQKRYRGTSKLVDDTKIEVEELEQQQAALVEVTTMDRPLGLGYGAARRRALKLAEEIAPTSLTVPSPIASPVTTPAATIAVDEDEFLKVEGVLALEAWAGHTNAQRAAMWQAIYEDHRLVHDLLVQNATIQRKFQEMRDRVTTLEEERGRRE
ncbi:hypothetical protein Tco_0631577, partial [Tanacetum coccineum]